RSRIPIRVRAGRGSDRRLAAPPPDLSLAVADEDGFDHKHGRRQQRELYLAQLVRDAVHESQAGISKILAQLQADITGLRQDTQELQPREPAATRRWSSTRSTAFAPSPTLLTSRPRAEEGPATPFRPRRSDAASNLMLGAESVTRLSVSPARTAPRLHTRQCDDNTVERGDAKATLAELDIEYNGRHQQFEFHRPKSKDIGVFDPDKVNVFNWWRGLAQFYEFSKHTEDEVMAAMPGCFGGAARTWFSNLAPPPRSLLDLRAKVFKAYSRPESHISELLEEKKFIPAVGTLADYLDDKYSLVTELHTARAVSRGMLDADPRCLDAVMTTTTVRDAIEQAHRGLPAYWQTILDACARTAEDWADYRSSMLANENRTRQAVLEMASMVGLAYHSAPVSPPPLPEPGSYTGDVLGDQHVSPQSVQDDYAV
ncbi:unnamed protein product, partial [Tilletia controversa]